jgi:hypothetical protein
MFHKVICLAVVIQAECQKAFTNKSAIYIYVIMKCFHKREYLFHAKEMAFKKLKAI